MSGAEVYNTIVHSKGAETIAFEAATQADLRASTLRMAAVAQELPPAMGGGARRARFHRCCRHVGRDAGWRCRSLAPGPPGPCMQSCAGARDDTPDAYFPRAAAPQEKRGWASDMPMGFEEDAAHQDETAAHQSDGRHSQLLDFTMSSRRARLARRSAAALRWHKVVP